MQVHDDLATLFSRNLRLEPAAAATQLVSAEEPKITYISQHYHHSSHIARPSDQPDPQQRPASEPPHPERLAIETVLRDHGVDPSALSASQMQLFKTADEPQQARLVELWRICPPERTNDDPTLAWGNTSVEQEEVLAKLRFERRMQEEQHQQEQEQQPQSVMSLDGTMLTPIQGGDGRWLHSVAHYMEPYMSSGYEALARREYEESARRHQQQLDSPLLGTHAQPPYSPSTDPVYSATANGSSEWARQQQMMMENQYGAFEQFRSDDTEML